MNDDQRFIYVCAPLKGDITGNIAKARKYCKTVLSMGYIPISAHVMFDGILNDTIPKERETALEIGLSLVMICDELWIFSEVITDGMQPEIEIAERSLIPVKTVCVDYERQDEIKSCYDFPLVFKDGECPKCGGDTHGINTEPMRCENCGWLEEAQGNV